MTQPGTPLLAPAPGHHNPGPGANAGRLYDMNPARRLDASGSAFDRACDGWTMHRLTVIRPATGTEPGLCDAEVFPASSVRPDAYQAWLGHVWPAAACTHPVLLRGTVTRLDTATGEILNRVNTDDLPDSAIYKPCGNRRASVCPGCAETYRRDAFHLIRSGLVGGKGITAEVSAHPAVFATFTAPSFGTVHTRTVRRHTCAYRDNCTCKPEPCHARRDAGTCPHGRPTACFRRHGKHDPDLGHPLCPDCYDYRAAVVWNNCAGELWRRTKQHIERCLNALARNPRPAPGPGLPRQGSRVPGTRRSPLPHRDPPRRHQPRRPDDPPGLSRRPAASPPTTSATPSATRPDGSPSAPSPIRSRGTAGSSAGANKSTYGRSASGEPANSPTWPSPVTSPSTPPREPKTAGTPRPGSPPTTSASTPKPTAPTPNASFTPAGNSARPPARCTASTTAGTPCAAGRTCSASVGTS